jgi:hypothetical protein
MIKSHSKINEERFEIPFHVETFSDVLSDLWGC